MVAEPALALALVAGMAQERTVPLFRTSTEVVQIDVFVGDDGKAITGLTRDAFTLFDNGEEREIDILDVTTIPLTVAAVLDTSQSVAGAKLRHLQDGVHAFIDGLEGQDRAALVTFSQHVSLSVDLTVDHAALHNAVNGVKPFGATAWHDAMFVGLKIVEGSGERPVLLLFSDGADTYSFLLEEQMLPLVEQSDAVVYAIIPAVERPSTGTAFSTERRRWHEFQRQRARRTELLRRLTATSGGRLIEARSSDRLKEAFLAILAEMKTRYLLTFEPPAPIQRGWHEIEVEVDVRGAEVRARRGYFYE